MIAFSLRASLTNRRRWAHTGLMLLAFGALLTVQTCAPHPARQPPPVAGTAG